MAPPPKLVYTQSAPTTPTKSTQGKPHHDVIEKLNNEYNLGIELPDETSTPRSRSTRAKFDIAFARNKKIVENIQHHYYMETGSLDKILHSFRFEARAASQKWLRSTSCYDSTSATPESPKATSPGEVLELQTLLINVLDKVGPQVKARIFERTQSGPASHGSFGGLTPRLRSTEGNPSNTPFSASANTSRSSLFSEASDPPRSTQETVPTPTFENQLQDLSLLDLDEPDSDDTSASQPVSSLDGFELVDLYSRLDDIWPSFPPWLDGAPLTVAWEITRIALHCDVDLSKVVMSYDDTWMDYNHLWRSLQAHPSFVGKAFPERPSTAAWTAGLCDFKSPQGQHVIFSATLHQTNTQNSGPVFSLMMRPIALDQGCRLHRRFGSDRFLDLLIPSPDSWQKPISNPSQSQEIIHWLSCHAHEFVGRQWQSFYAKDAGHKMPQKNVGFGPDPKPVYQDRIIMFAESDRGDDAVISKGLRALDSHHKPWPKISTQDMLDWLLQFDRNEGQSYLKLFTRIQLGLSKTTPILELNHEQIRHCSQDMLSPIGKVMNDGIGRMSRSLARMVRDVLGLEDTPSAIQGRLGSAKGMWIIDIKDTEDDLWIETWPSQRKWDCDFHDPEHRTLEIKSHATQPRSASLNIQFLPVLEDRARNKEAMREAVGNSLIDELKHELDEQRYAMDYPVQFRQWVNENSSSKFQRLAQNGVSFLAGLPDSKEEVMNFLIDGGFQPQEQKYLQDVAWQLREARCEKLKKKLNIKIPNSANLYMVVDFWGVLEENEVHICFSSKFQTQSFSDSMLHGCDVLVARSPAHLVSDIQRVKAVFKPELHSLKDVIVFSAKGKAPLADKLSGGDYDGDKAWVCWEPAIVSNFVNANIQPGPDLSKYLKRKKATYGDLVRLHGKANAISNFIEKSICFSLLPGFLGRVTNYKERLCYRINSVNNEYALRLSTLLGHLVDQAKQGYMFTAKDWEKFQRELLDSKDFKMLDEPAYKRDIWSCKRCPEHIIDYLKFTVAIPTINEELTKFKDAMNSKADISGYDLKSLQPNENEDKKQTAEYWDPTLARYYKYFKQLALQTPALEKVLQNLYNDLDEIKEQWSIRFASKLEKKDSPRIILEVYELWRAIQPREDEELSTHLTALLEQPFVNENYNTWALLRASTAFVRWHKHSSKLLWRMAGIQLQYLKSMEPSTSDKIPVTVVPSVYAALKPDAKFIRQTISRMNNGPEYRFESDTQDSFTDEE
ncbi:RNA-dependent RNA polymerase [Colletotrichum truncatum]|uniref:RNA-dependent RNA polymerase n=1 Tax=Colletotrichum truncatum TaxID=5467 RepID=A0ACC3YPH2_COLTU|nr:RNA-dependent RNA polymerase [Colletotrichum truncatum]KAF6784249.1 RNA-dependent RNA polymerase [Colletotrichum truncatum]